MVLDETVIVPDELARLIPINPAPVSFEVMFEAVELPIVFPLIVTVPVLSFLMPTNDSV